MLDLTKLQEGLFPDKVRCFQFFWSEKRNDRPYSAFEYFMTHWIIEPDKKEEIVEYEDYTEVYPFLYLEYKKPATQNVEFDSVQKFFLKNVRLDDCLVRRGLSLSSGIGDFTHAIRGMNERKQMLQKDFSDGFTRTAIDIYKGEHMRYLCFAKGPIQTRLRNKSWETPMDIKEAAERHIVRLAHW